MAAIAVKENSMHLPYSIAIPNWMEYVKKNFQNHLINESGKIRNLHINQLNIQVKNAIFSKDRVCSMCSIGKCHIFGPKGQQN